MKRGAGILILVMLFLGCETPTVTEVPTDLIPRDQLIGIIIDLETLEAYYEQTHKRPTVYKDALDSACSVLLYDKGVTKQQLETSIAYYSFYPDSIFSLYESTLDSANSLVNTNP